jgi:hypothetical protein
MVRTSSSDDVRMSVEADERAELDAAVSRTSEMVGALLDLVDRIVIGFDDGRQLTHADVERIREHSTLWRQQLHSSQGCQMTAAIYARKSTDQSGISDEQRSIARQVEHARTYAARQGWRVLDEHA